MWLLEKIVDFKQLNPEQTVLRQRWREK